MKRKFQRFLSGILAVCFLCGVPAAAADDMILRCQKEDSGIQLTLEGSRKEIYAVQLELTLKGERPKVSFTSLLQDVYSPPCRVEAERVETAVTIYLVSEDAPLDGRNLRLGILEGVEEYPIKAEALLLDRSLEAVGSRRVSIVEEKSEQKTENQPVTPPSSQDGTNQNTTSPSVPAEKELPFTDVKPLDWCYPAVRYVYEAGLMQGTSTTQFTPDANTTRGHIVTILYRIEGSPTTQARQFSDVAASSYCYNAVSWGSAKGIVNGYSDGTFKPNNLITQEQLAAFLYRYALAKGKNVTARADLSRYKDAGQVSSYALEPYQWAIASGVFASYDAVTLQPRMNVSRGQLAVILTRFMQNV